MTMSRCLVLPSSVSSSVCSHVKLYGFYHSAGFRFPYHYFNSEVPTKGGKAIHDYQAELEDILRLARHG